MAAPVAEPSSSPSIASAILSNHCLRGAGRGRCGEAEQEVSDGHRYVANRVSTGGGKRPCRNIYRHCIQLCTDRISPMMKMKPTHETVAAEVLESIDQEQASEAQLARCAVLAVSEEPEA